MSHDRELEVQLREKEELVAALTERLELAAEQLDRLQRTGADRRGRTGGGGGGGFPAELIDRHQTLVDDLQQAVLQWQEMQAEIALGSLQSQMTELRELVASGLNGGGKHSAGRPAAAPVIDASGIPDDDADDEPAGDGDDRWAALKSYLLHDDDTPQAAAKQNVEKAGDGRETEIVAAASGFSPPDALDTVDPPIPIDPETADAAVLWVAVESRDQYIAYLIRKLRYAHANPPLPADWAAVAGMPEELCRRVEELQAELDEKLRLTEVELSLERARLGREQSRIRQLEDNTRRTMRQLGLNPDAAADEQEFEPDAGNGNRWLRMLGIGREDEDDD